MVLQRSEAQKEKCSETKVSNLELFNVIKKELYSTALVSFLVDYLWSECHLEVRKHGALYAFVLKNKIIVLYK